MNYATRSDDVVKAGRLFAQKWQDERNAVADLERIKTNGFAEDSSVGERFKKNLEHARVQFDAAILDWSSTITEAAALERLEADRGGSVDLRIVEVRSSR